MGDHSDGQARISLLMQCLPKANLQVKMSGRMVGHKIVILWSAPQPDETLLKPFSRRMKTAGNGVVPKCICLNRGRILEVANDCTCPSFFPPVGERDRDGCSDHRRNILRRRPVHISYFGDLRPRSESGVLLTTWGR